MENSENLIADLEEDLKLLEVELDDISKRGSMVDVPHDLLAINGKSNIFANENIESDKIFIHGNSANPSNIEIASEISTQTDGIILPNDEFLQSELASVTVPNQAKNSIFIDADINEVLDPLKATVTVERDKSLGIINNSEISVGSHFSSIADNSSDILVKGIGSFYNKIEDDNSVILLDANICDEINISRCDELPTSSLVDSIIAEGYDSGIGNTRLVTSDPLSTVGLLMDESGIQVMGVGHNSFQEDLEITASLVNPDIGEVGMITVDPLFNEGLSVDESGIQLMGVDHNNFQEDVEVTASLISTKDIDKVGMITGDPLFNEGLSVAESGIQLMGIDHSSLQKDNQIIETVKEAADEFSKTLSIDREKICIKSYAKNFNLSSKITRREFNIVVINFINVEGDVYENEINLIS